MDVTRRSALVVAGAAATAMALLPRTNARSFDCELNQRYPDSMMVFNAQGNAIGFIRLPERWANLTFGGLKNNRLFMASRLRSMRFVSKPHGAA